MTTQTGPEFVRAPHKAHWGLTLALFGVLALVFAPALVAAFLNTLTGR
jgi:hypothetical protein